MKYFKKSELDVNLIRIRRIGRFLPFVALSVGISSCVNLAAPDEPIVINLNIKIDQEVTIKAAEAVENAIEENAGIF